MSKMLNFAQQLVNANRNNIPNAPWAEAAINAVMNGDAKAGEQIADIVQPGGSFFTARNSDAIICRSTHAFPPL